MPFSKQPSKSSITKKVGLKWTVITPIIVLHVLIIIFSYNSFRMVHRENLRIAERRLQVDMQKFSENVRTVLNSLKSVIFAIEDRILLSNCIDECLHPFLVKQKQLHPTLRVLLVVNPKGIITVGSRTPMKAVGIDVSDRPYFRTHLNNHEPGVYIGPPNRSRVNNEWSMPISKAVLDESGNLMGVIVASIEPRYFDQVFDSVVPESGKRAGSFIKQAIITLDDTTVLSLYPFNENTIGTKFKSNPLFKLTEQIKGQKIIYSHTKPLQSGTIISRISLAPVFPLNIY